MLFLFEIPHSDPVHPVKSKAFPLSIIAIILPKALPQIDFPAPSCIWLEDRSHHVCFTAKSSKVLNTPRPKQQ